MKQTHKNISEFYSYAQVKGKCTCAALSGEQNAY